MAGKCWLVPHQFVCLSLPITDSSLSAIKNHMSKSISSLKWAVLKSILISFTAARFCLVVKELHLKLVWCLSPCPGVSGLRSLGVAVLSLLGPWVLPGLQGSALNPENLRFPWLKPLLVQGPLPARFLLRIIFSLPLFVMVAPTIDSCSSSVGSSLTQFSAAAPTGT